MPTGTASPQQPVNNPPRSRTPDQYELFITQRLKQTQRQVKWWDMRAVW